MGQLTSRRDFLRLRRSDRGRVLELSCQTFFMRCNDARGVEQANAAGADEHEPWMGEPPARLNRRSADDLIASFEQDLREVEVLRLVDAEWLDQLEEAPRIDGAIAAFRTRGGAVERA